MYGTIPGLDDGPAWYRAAWCELSLEAGVPHRLEVEKAGSQLTVGVNGASLWVPPDGVRAGCESRDYRL